MPICSWVDTSHLMHPFKPVFAIDLVDSGRASNLSNYLSGVWRRYYLRYSNKVFC